MPTTLDTRTVQSTDDAERTAASLVQRSVFFTVTPLPDDEYRFAVKPEDFDQLVNASRPS